MPLWSSEFWEARPQLADWLTSGAILALFLGGAILVRLAWKSLMMRLLGPDPGMAGDLLIKPARGLVVWALVLAGIYYAVDSLLFIQDKPGISESLAKGLSLAWTALAIVTAFGVINATAEAYSHRQVENVAEIAHRASILRKVAYVVVILLGGLYALRILGIDTGPLLASGAVGGIIGGISMKDVLSNIAAGFLMNVDRPMRIGDLVKLQSGEEGFIEEIGWRNSKIKLWSNNVVIIPNGKLSESILINYNQPAQETSVNIPCGVSYDSDLEFVEKITVEVGQQVQNAVEGGHPEWTPLVRWKTFGDFSITFVVILRVKDPTAQYLLQSEFVKALHKRYREEGIEIPFPIRRVITES